MLTKHTLTVSTAAADSCPPPAVYPPSLCAEAEMRCLREWVPAIAASCAMKVQWSAQVEALAEQAASARTLVAQARKPLVALNSFGNMLVGGRWVAHANSQAPICVVQAPI